MPYKDPVKRREAQARYRQRQREEVERWYDIECLTRWMMDMLKGYAINRPNFTLDMYLTATKLLLVDLYKLKAPMPQTFDDKREKTRIRSPSSAPQSCGASPPRPRQCAWCTACFDDLSTL
jgi:hypothetical protein